MKTIKVSLGINRCSGNSNNRRKNIRDNIGEINNTDNLSEKIKELSEAIKRDSIRNKYHRRQRQRVRGIGRETKITPHSVIMTDKAYDNATKLYLKKKLIGKRRKRIMVTADRTSFIPVIPADKWDEFNKRMEKTIQPKEERERMEVLLSTIPHRKRNGRF